MQQQQPKFPIKRKPVSFKAINNKLSKRRKINNFLSPVEQNFNQEDKKYLPERQAQKNIGQNISLIAKKQQGSFISNRQDHSLDSFDKMIMGVDEQLDIEYENTSYSKENDLNYTLLYQEFEKLIKTSKMYKNDEVQMEIQEQSKILREDFFQHQDEKLKESSSFEMSNSGLNNIKLLKQKIEEIKDIRKQKIINQSNASDQNISLRLLGANLSEIHEEEIQHNMSINRMDPIEEEFIDFVSKNNEASKINISKIEKNNVKEEKKVYKFNKNELNTSIKQPEEDQVVAMLENELGSRRENLIQEESLIDEQSELDKKKGKKQFFEKENYHQILRQLDENEDKKLDTSQINTSNILTKREQWINNRSDRSSKWKTKELQLIAKIKEILFNPYVEFSDDEEFNLEI